MATILLDIPKVWQLTTVTGDGKPSENAQMDCVAASVDLLCRYVLGTPENSIFNPDTFKDQAYGDAYTGGTAASEYVAYVKTLGVRLYSMDTPDYGGVVAYARMAIRDKRQPVLFTRDDPYVDSRLHPDWTHVSVFYGCDDVGLTAHDPYINAAVYKTDAGWVDVLRSKEVWLAEKEDEMVQPLSIDMPEVAALFIEVDRDHWRSKATGKILQYGLKDDYVKNGIVSLIYLGDIVSNEIYIGPQVAKQHYSKGVRVWSNGAVSSLDLYTGSGQDPLIKKLQDRLSSALQIVNALLKEMMRPI